MSIKPIIVPSKTNIDTMNPLLAPKALSKAISDFFIYNHYQCGNYVEIATKIIKIKLSSSPFFQFDRSKKLCVSVQLTK